MAEYVYLDRDDGVVQFHADDRLAAVGLAVRTTDDPAADDDRRELRVLCRAVAELLTLDDAEDGNTIRATVARSRRIERLIDAGLSPAAAEKAALGKEIAPGVRVVVVEED